MTYVMSDLHGRHEAFLAMLEKIKFCDDDLLFLNGDIIDCGDAPLRLLLDISYRTNVFSVLGDREFIARPILHALYADGDPVAEEEIEKWLTNGGESTLREMEALPEEQRKSVLDYLDDLPSFEAVSINEINHIMVHGGLASFSPRRRLESYQPKEVIYASSPFGQRYYKNSLLLTGHVPTHYIDKDRRGEIVVTPFQIALDCGAAEGVRLGCFCMETQEKFYINL